MASSSWQHSNRRVALSHKFFVQGNFRQELGVCVQLCILNVNTMQCSNDECNKGAVGKQL